MGMIELHVLVLEVALLLGVLVLLFSAILGLRIDFGRRRRRNELKVGDNDGRENSPEEAENMTTKEGLVL